MSSDLQVFEADPGEGTATPLLKRMLEVVLNAKSSLYHALGSR